MIHDQTNDPQLRNKKKAKLKRLMSLKSEVSRNSNFGTRRRERQHTKKGRNWLDPKNDIKGSKILK